ncbi:MAG TPA: aldo/keto reductase [Thermodesulfobacteriota bacterium]|nr:aldo/keto reductase [Thermodesulfobacteriota bacterium]
MTSIREKWIVQMPYRRLGRTGEMVSLLGLGGYHIGIQKEEQESIRLIRTAIDNGVNFLDNSWDYNDGVSEIRMGKALKDGYRKRAFLMTKIDGQDRKTAESQIAECLRRLQTETIDLLQFHEIIRMEDPDRIFAEGGAFEAALEARKAGKIRYIGFTGHKSPEIHLKMIRKALNRGFPFDAVQMPLNIMDAHYDSFQKKVIPVLQENDIGVLGMKAFGEKHILKSGAVTAEECLRYAMDLPLSVIIVGCDTPACLEQAIGAARDFRPFSADEKEALLARTAEAGKDGRFEPFKTTSEFDATDRNPHWLGL